MPGENVSDDRDHGRAYSGWFASSRRACKAYTASSELVLRCCLRLRYRHLVALKQLAGVEHLSET